MNHCDYYHSACEHALAVAIVKCTPISETLKCRGGELILEMIDGGTQVYPTVTASHQKPVRST